VLEGARNTLVWYVSHKGSRPDQVAQHHLLSRLIVTRTGLPLRDYSAAAEAIANARKTGGQVGKSLLRGEHPAISAEAARAIVNPRLPASGWPIVFAALALVGVEVVVFLGGWLTQHFLVG
jgi:hypothetical protein